MFPSDIVVIIEDDKSLAISLRDILNEKGFLALMADSAKTAQPLLPVAALALIDMKLPDKSGIQLLQELKEKNPDTEAIIVTGFADKDSAIESINLGAFAYLEKPLDMEKLLLYIKRALERRKLTLDIKRREQEIKGVTSMMFPVLNERIRLLDEARQRQERIARLYKGISLAFRSLDPLEAAKQLLPLIADEMEANRVAIMLVGADEKPGESVRYFKGMKPNEITPRAGGMRNQVVKTGKPVYVPDITKDPNSHPDLLAAGLKSHVIAVQIS